HPTSEQLARAKTVVAEAKNKDSLEFLYAQEVMALADWPDRIAIPLQLLRIGDVAIAGIPGEVFVETGLAYKAKSPFKLSFIVSLANGSYGYIPTPEQHKLGGYETWPGTNRLETQASTKILDRLLEMTAKLK